MDWMFKKCGYCAMAIVLVAFISFFLGGIAVSRLHTSTTNDAILRLEEIPITTSIDERVYSSSRGSRYYPWWCDKGSAIDPDNMVWYETPQEAEEAGYTIAKGCE